jgi:Uma2 family endonuclease
MSVSIPRPPRPKVVYPDDDGLPLADNTLQFEWIVTIKHGLDGVFMDRPDVFVAGNLLWYPVEGDPKTRSAPDVMVAFGRPKGYRGSYKQWEEEGIPPQVTFEVLSPGNRLEDMLEKLRFYEKFGVEEYYLFNPDDVKLTGWLRSGTFLNEIAAINGWTSPKLRVQFHLNDDDLVILGPDGRRFLTYLEIFKERDQAERQRDEAKRQRDDEREQRIVEQRKLDQEIQRRADAERRADELAAKLRSLGIEP